MGFTDHLRSIGCWVSVVGLRLVIRWRNLLESVVREFIAIFVYSLTTDDILLWLADEFGESLEFANKRKAQGGLLPEWRCRLWWRWGGFQLDVGDTFGTNEAIITFNIVIEPSEQLPERYIVACYHHDRNARKKCDGKLLCIMYRASGYVRARVGFCCW